ncbi:universal stress protein [Polaromonas sp. P1(28)-8]|nr:universal stress protein [Polaromonas sp. P1(28)-8]
MENSMQKILIPFDGSPNALRAVRYAATAVQEKSTLELELLHVLDPMSLRSHATLTNIEVNDLYASEADQVLQPARQILDQAGIPYQAHYRVGGRQRNRSASA